MQADVFISESVSQVLKLYHELIDERAWSRTAREQIELLADRLLEGHRVKHHGAAVELHNWLPNAVKLSTLELFELNLTRADALETVARSHGFSGWSTAELSTQHPGDPVFEQTIEIILAGDITALSAALDHTPDLVARRSHYGHRSTLLHYLTANGVETYRQRVPLNASSIAAILIERGADVLAPANAYGRSLTVRHLLVTSGHPHEAKVTTDILAVLDGAGGPG